MQVIQDQRHRRVLGRQRRREPQHEPMAGVRPRAAGSAAGAATPDRRSAATTYVQKTLGRLSNSSTVTQAACPGPAAAHNASAIVLPAPAGPVTTVSGHHRLPWAISSVIRGRGTAQSGTPGAVIFDARTGTPPETAGRSAEAAGTALRNVVHDHRRPCGQLRGLVRDRRGDIG